MSEVDTLTAALDEIRDLVGKRNELVARTAVSGVRVLDFNAAQDRLADTAPRLLAALDEVLKRHQPVKGDWGTSCSCWDRGGSHPVWPCPEMMDVALALLGEESGRG